MLAKIERVETPSHILNEMEIWRAGFGSIPRSYIIFHRGLAKARLKVLVKEHGIRVLHKEMVSGGWFDGMRELRAVVETKMGKLRDLRWCDTNQDFMVKGIGQSALYEGDLK